VPQLFDLTTEARTKYFPFPIRKETDTEKANEKHFVAQQGFAALDPYIIAVIFD